MNRVMRPSCILAVSSLMSACGTGGGAPAGDPSERLHGKLASALCDGLVACPDAFEGAGVMSLYAKADRAACVAFMTALHDHGHTLPGLEAAIRAGTVRLVDDALPACLDAIRVGCGLEPESVQACRAAFEGTLASGQACRIDTECAGDAACGHDLSGCGRLCRQRSLRGQPCTEDCSLAAGPTECNTQGVCARVEVETGVAAGGACSSQDEGEVIRHRSCAAGHHCDYDQAANDRICKRSAQPGETCESETQCAAGHTCSASSRCEPVPVLGSPGASCGAGLCNTMRRLACLDGVCVAMGDGGEGSTCSHRAPDVLACRAGLHCARAEAQCQATRGPGAACGSNDECQSGDCDGGACGATACD